MNENEIHRDGLTWFKTTLQVPKFGSIMGAGSKVQFGSSRFGSRTV